MLKIGLTGPTGSGKSTVTALMRQWGGVEILDADAIAHEVMESDACKAALAAVVFGSPASLRRLGEISYPPILAECKKRMEEASRVRGARACVLDAPTLFESGGDALCDVLVSVVTPRAIRLQRILQRDGITVEAAEARMKNQHEDFFYTYRAHFVIENSSDLAHLRQETERCRRFLRL